MLNEKIRPEIFEYRATEVQLTAEGWGKMVREWAEASKRYINAVDVNGTEQERKYLREQNMLINVFEDLIFYIDMVAKSCDQFTTRARAMRELREGTPVPVRRWIIRDGALMEASLEEAAEHEGLTPTEYLARENEMLKEAEDWSSDNSYIGEPLSTPHRTDPADRPDD